MSKTKQNTKKKSTTPKKKPSRHGKLTSEAKKTTKTKKSTNRIQTAKKKKQAATSFALAQAVVPFQSITITTPDGLDANSAEVLDFTLIAIGAISPPNSSGSAQVLTLSGGTASDPVAFVALGTQWSAGPFQRPSGGGNLLPGDYLLRAQFPGNEDAHQIRIRIGSMGIITPTGPLDPETYRRIRSQAERITEELRQKYGEREIAVDLIRETRDEE